MNKKEFSIIFLLFFFITAMFFYKTFLHGFIPFPGDLLISEYSPLKYDSFLGYAAGGIPSKGQYFDVLRQMYPWKTLVIQMLKSGQFPLWNPYNFSGSPLFANIQSAVLYPLNIFYFIFPQKIAWTILIFCQPFLTALFTYLFARKINLSKIGAFFSAVTFAFSTFLSVWLEYNTIGQVVVWLPLSMLAIEQLLIKKSKLWSIIFITSLVTASLAGHIQVFGYQLVFIFLYAGHRINTTTKYNSVKKNSLLFISILFILSLGISSIQTFPAFELIQYSARSPHAFSNIMGKILIQPYQIIMLFVPDFFGNPATRNYWLTDTYIGKVISIGIVPLFFVFLSITKWKNVLIRFFIGAMFLILLFVTSNPLTYFLYSLNLPFISSSAPTLSIFLLCFSMSILCGFGIDSFQTEKISFKKFCSIIGLLFLPFIIGWVSIFILPKVIHTVWIVNMAISKRNLIYSSGILLFSVILLFCGFINKRTVVYILILLLGVQIFDSFRYFEKFNPFVSQQLVFPQNDMITYLSEQRSINRFYGFDNSGIPANIATQYHLFSSEGYDPLYPKWYGEFIQSSQNGAIQTTFTDKTRSDAVIYPGFDSSNTARLKVLNLLGTKYILDRVENGSSENTFPPEDFSIVYQESGWKIFENKNALPRFFLSSDYTTYSSPTEFGKLFFDKNFHPLQTLLFEKDPQVHLDGLVNTERVDLVLYSPNTIVFATHTQGDHLLFLSDTYYPGWKATVDGKETEIYKTDYAFRSILLPAGSHEVIFTFESASFKIGSVVSIITLFLTTIFLFRKSYDQKVT